MKRVKIDEAFKLSDKELSKVYAGGNVQTTTTTTICGICQTCIGCTSGCICCKNIAFIAAAADTNQQFQTTLTTNFTRVDSKFNG